MKGLEELELEINRLQDLVAGLKRGNVVPINEITVSSLKEDGYREISKDIFYQKKRVEGFSLIDERGLISVASYDLTPSIPKDKLVSYYERHMYADRYSLMAVVTHLIKADQEK